LVGDEGKTENHVRQNLGYSVSDSEGRKIRVWLTLAPSVRPPSAPGGPPLKGALNGL
jgi:hypothetical protein